MKNTTNIINILSAPIVLVAVLALLAVAAFSSTATVPNTFVPGTVANANLVNANFRALRDAINSNVPRRTLIVYSGSTVMSPAADFVYEKARVLGTFDKQSADTDILLTWNSNVAHDGNFANWQLRIDDLASGSSPGSGAAVMGASVTSESTANTFALFTGLATGMHEVSLWVRSQTTTTLEENAGNYNRQVLVEEQFTN